MAERLRQSEIDAAVAALDDRAAAVFRQLAHSPSFLGLHQIAEKLKAPPQQLDPILKALLDAGLVEQVPASRRRPFGPLYRPAPARIETVGDWLKGGAADRGYDSLEAIRRDYPSVKSLADPADGAEAAKTAADHAAKLKKDAAAAAEENATQQRKIEERRARNREAKAAAQAEADAQTGNGDGA